MKTYLVGGAVRDELLQQPVKERDWVVVGATPDAMIEAGYRPIGKDFPVFLHPETREEYALARTERKTAPGYHGFRFYTDPNITLEQDLQRRDLTINAIAKDENGALIDPCGGLTDLQERKLRHISKAFAEDPVRVLRVARFATRFDRSGFKIAEETQDLMQQMVASGEINTLVPERVWAEMHKALSEDYPSVFFNILRACGALKILLPELDRLWGIPQPKRWHPEIDTGVHTMMVLDQAARLTNNTQVRFAALVHDLGKGTTPANILPAHHGHEHRSVELVKQVSQRLRIPNHYRDLAIIVARYHGCYHRVIEMKASTIMEKLRAIDAFRRPARFEQFLLACEADARGRTGLEGIQPPQTQQMREMYQAAASIDVQPLIKGLKGASAALAIKREQIEKIEAVRQTWQETRKNTPSELLPVFNRPTEQ